MKRFYLLCLLLLAGMEMFASVEVDTMKYGSLFAAKFENDETRIIPAAGMETAFNFFFLPFGKTVDAGLNIDSGVGIAGASMGGFFSVAPVVRWTVSESHSFSFAPGMKVEQYLGSRDAGFVSVPLVFAYKYWFFNAPGLHIGINTGLSIDVLLFGFYEFTDRYVEESEVEQVGSATYTVYNYYRYPEYEMTHGIAHRFFFGLCFNFGDRTFDKRR